ncbi:class I SAM-dependent methyltransferase [Bradyrhizobium sp. LTSP857]|uniref:class I SAM-dependent methyltransferase n=1 Tax=Bradyrhizobium sp. LTSP857 TaxID=1619231 RepID=UPI0005D1CFE0|nr:class I SAM-dependent methyltransferase [Bradyrhizobium sp. LTSP857]KJC50797.1 methyltransferase [Bradyrhizobium sp. LTSP857]
MMATTSTRPLTEIKGCEVCGNDKLVPVLDLGLHPLCDDLVTVGDSRQCREYPILIDFCPTCATGHQRFQVPKEDLFPRDYHYRSRFTADVLSGMKSLVATCAERMGSLTGKVVLDIGCNDGSLLDFFREAGAKTAGIEPTGAAQDAAAKGHFVVQNYLSTETAAEIRRGVGTPDIITFTNVFAHIEDLKGVLAALKALLGHDTVIVIENHYLGAVLDRHQFDTFYHEHPRTYSYKSFSFIARSLGLDIANVEFPARYGGNIRVILGGAASKAGDAVAADVVARENNFQTEFAQLARDVDLWKARKGEELKTIIAAHGPIRAKAFPGRAAILVKLLGLTEKEIVAVHEKPGSIKIGHYVPGTRIPIVSDDELFARGDQGKPLLNLAWHISPEIRQYLSDNGYKGPVIDVLGAGDFHA